VGLGWHNECLAQSARLKSVSDQCVAPRKVEASTLGLLLSRKRVASRAEGVAGVLGCRDAGLGVLGGAGVTRLGGGGFCFHRLTMPICPKAKSCLVWSRAWAPVPSGSSKEKVREDDVPERYVEGSLTHEGFWVIMREA
jgi:hypothetical protein